MKLFAKNKGWYVWAAAGVLTVFRLVLSAGLLVQFESGSQYDDLLQIGKAMSVASGNWLGAYGGMTLVKGVGYPLLTALFSVLGLPYVFAYHLLYVIACGLFMLAVKPLVGNKWVGLAVYGFMLFNPIAFSGQITRLYRDIGYYSLALLCIAFSLGVLTRYKEKTAKWFALGGGTVTAFACLWREDSQWLLIYAAACFAAMAVLRLAAAGKKAVGAIGLAALLAAGGAAAVVLPVCAVNYTWYGTFTTDEYNSGAFARAYGALSRLDGGNEDPHITIPYEMRVRLYELSPAFAELEEVLDGEDTPLAAWKGTTGDYRTGYFSFVLRQAAETIGKYDSAATADEYFSRLADEVNAICDSGQLEAGPRRAGITARYYSWMTGPIIKTTFESVWATLRCTDINPFAVPANEDDAYLQTFEAFAHATISADRYMETGETVQNYQLSGVSLFGQRVMRVAITIYRLALPVLFFASLLGFVAGCVLTLQKGRKEPGAWLKALVPFSLLCAFLLRCAMLAFVHVSTFGTIYTPSYTAASYPVLLAFIATGCLFGGTAIWQSKVRR